MFYLLWLFSVALLSDVLHNQTYETVSLIQPRKWLHGSDSQFIMSIYSLKY